MAGRLAIDFGNAYTIAAYWRQGSRLAETLYVPGVTRPVRTGADHSGKAVYAAPSLILYGGSAEEYLIGQEVAENLSGLTDDRRVFNDLRMDIITGKRVYSAAGGRRLSGQEIARDYLAAIISQAGQALGLGNEAVITFTVPVAVCRDEVVWQRYRNWLAAAVRQAGFSRLELIEQPWAAAWGAGMRVKPGDRYLVLDLDADNAEAAVVEAGHSTGSDQRQLRVLSYVHEWLRESEQEGKTECISLLEELLRQTLRQAARQGYAGNDLTGVIVTGEGVQQPQFRQVIHDIFAGMPIYDTRFLDAAACGAAALTAGYDTCGYIRHDYGLRYLEQDHYQYRLLTASGTFYPSDGPVAELTIKASYEGQQEYALFIYRLEQGGSHCINEENPLILTASAPAGFGQDAVQASISIDGAGKLLVTAYEVGSKRQLADNAPVARLM